MAKIINVYKIDSSAGGKNPVSTIATTTAFTCPQCGAPVSLVSLPAGQYTCPVCRQRYATAPDDRTNETRAHPFE